MPEQNKKQKAKPKRTVYTPDSLPVFAGYIKCVGVSQVAGKASANSLKYLLLNFLLQ